MFGFAKKFFAPKANPIGVDFGTDGLRMAQVRREGNEFKLIAAASADVPSHVRNDPNARAAFFVETARDLLAQGGFVGKQVVLSLPAAMMVIQHLRMAKMDDEATKKTLVWEAQGKLPMDPSNALLRHIVAGEIYQDTEPQQEVILMAAKREAVDKFLAMATKARLDVIGLNIEPKALVDCFQHIYRRKTDADVTNCFVDIGSSATRAVVSRGEQILFARSIPIGGDHFNRAVASAMQIGFEDAKLLRIKLAAMTGAVEDRKAKQEIAQTPVEKPQEEPADEENSFALLGAGIRKAEQRTGMGGRIGSLLDDSSAGVAVMEESAGTSALPAAANGPAEHAAAVETATADVRARLVSELDLCRRYFESTFPSKPVDRLIFVGGEARQRGLCQQIARDLSLAAQVGDPLVRMGRTTEVGIESGIDRRQPQPAWAVAIGLSMGPAGGIGAATKEDRA